MTRLLPLVAVLLLATAAQAQPAEVVRTFEEGNRRFEEGDYRAALASYDTTLARGYASAGLYGNMGSAHFELGRYGQALRYFKKALRAAPDDERLAHNLEVVRQRLRDAPGGTSPTDGFLPTARTRLARSLAAWVPPVALLFLGLGLYLAGAVLLGDRLRARPRWSVPALVAGALVGGGLLLAGGGLATAAAVTSEAQAVVITAQPVLRAAPAPGAASLGPAAEGQVVRVERTAGGWTRVRLPDGLAGWLRSSDVGLI